MSVGSPSLGRTAAAVLLAASLCLVVVTVNRETPDLPGEYAGSSFVRLSNSNGQGHNQFQQFSSNAAQDALSPAIQSGPGDISALVQEDLDWLRDNSAPAEDAEGAEGTAQQPAMRVVEQHRVRVTAAAPEENLFETVLPDANSIFDSEMKQVGDMQMLAAKDMSKSKLVAATLAEAGGEEGKTLKEAKAVQKELHSQMEDEEQQVQKMLAQHARDVAQRNRQREASMHAKVMAAQADEKARQTRQRLHELSHSEKQKARSKLRKVAKKVKKKDTAASKVALHKLRQKTLAQRRRIEAASRDLRAHTAAANEAVVVEGAQAEQSLQTSKLHHKVQVESMASAVREDLPTKITGLTVPFDKKALHGTKSHPFKEAVLRHEGIKYNKLRKKVVTLTDRLSRLQQDAADAEAKKKFEEDEEQAKVVLHRQQDQAADDLALARFPKKYRAKIAKMQHDMMDEKMKQFQQERAARLQSEESHAEAEVEQDQKQIASVKKDLNTVLHHKLASVQASILQEVPGSGVELDTATVPAAPSAADGAEGAKENSGEVVKLLLEEVAALQTQQKHLVKALTSKRTTARVAGAEATLPISAEVRSDREY